MGYLRAFKNNSTKNLMIPYSLMDSVGGFAVFGLLLSMSLIICLCKAENPLKAYFSPIF